MHRSTSALVRRAAGLLALALSASVLVAAGPAPSEDDILAPRASLLTPDGGEVEGVVGSNCLSNGVADVCEEVSPGVPERTLPVASGSELVFLLRTRPAITEARAVLQRLPPRDGPIALGPALRPPGRLALRVPDGGWLLEVFVRFEDRDPGEVSGHATYRFHLRVGLPDTATAPVVAAGLPALMAVAWAAWGGAALVLVVVRGRVRRVGV